MLIIAGKVYVAAEQRDAYIAQHAEFIRRTRAEPGCLDVIIAADPIEEDRVNNFELWESQAKLDAFRRKAKPPQTNIERRDDQVKKGSSAQLMHGCAGRFWSTPAIWLISYNPEAGRPSVRYLHAVEEALCFGWIDGIAKRLDAERSAQRFTPRRARSHWTELNKERARRLIAAGLMTDAGRAVLPDLDVASFRIADDILAALQADPEVWGHFQRFPGAYQRIRIGYIEEMRRQPDIFHQRLEHFLRKTRQGTMFGTLE